MQDDKCPTIKRQDAILVVVDRLAAFGATARDDLRAYLAFEDRHNELILRRAGDLLQEPAEGVGVGPHRAAVGHAGAAFAQTGAEL